MTTTRVRRCQCGEPHETHPHGPRVRCGRETLRPARCEPCVEEQAANVAAPKPEAWRTCEVCLGDVKPAQRGAGWVHVDARNVHTPRTHAAYARPHRREG